jgi:hypothetical protein
MGRRDDRVNVQWRTGDDLTIERIGVEVLQDIREELRSLNALLHCPNFTGIPATLRSIARRLPARRRAK